MSQKSLLLSLNVLDLVVVTVAGGNRNVVAIVLFGHQPLADQDSEEEEETDQLNG